MRNFTLLVLIYFLSVLSVLAYDFAIENTFGCTIYYNKVSDSQVSVTNSDELKYEGSVVIPSEVSIAGIKYSVVGIDDKAFYDCIDLTEVIIPVTVTTIGDYAFYDCRSLWDIAIPYSVESIGEHAFTECSNLMKVAAPSTLADCYFGKMAIVFAYPTNMCSYTIGPDGAILMIWYKDTYLYYVSPHAEGSFEIPSFATKIGELAFMNCYKLTEVTIPNSITVIHKSTFYSCYGLTNILIPDSVISIENSAFYNCEGLKSVKIGDNVKQIGDFAFGLCTNLKSVHIPSSVTEMGSNPFSNCYKLESFEGKYASEDNRCLIVDNTLKSFAPAGLTEYNIPTTVTTIGASAFEGYEYIEKISIPNSLTTIGASAFEGCRSLTSLLIPNSVTHIGTYALWDCNNLTSVYVDNDNPDNIILANGALFGVHFFIHCVLYVPVGSVDAYRKAEQWKSFMKIEEWDKSGIESIDVDIDNVEQDIIYDLQGRRLQTPQRGIYIRNGKKILNIG